MSGLRLALTTLTLLIALVTAAPAADVISGVPYIVDGDTLSIGNLKIRLEGIDAPALIKTPPPGHAASLCVTVSRSELASIRSIALPGAPTGTVGPLPNAVSPAKI